MDTIDITQLNKGLPTVTEKFCQMFAETAIFCLQHNSHKSSHCVLDCINNINADDTFKLIWPEPDKRINDTYNDLEEATEYGATGIAILLSIKLTKYSTVLRSYKTTGFDYWLGDKTDSLFQEKARLEISGILNGNDTQFNTRIKQKFKQTNTSDNSGLECFVSVVEFGKPKASFLSKEKYHEKN
jgi:hypothetical protein